MFLRIVKQKRFKRNNKNIDFSLKYLYIAKKDCFKSNKYFVTTNNKKKYFK